MCAIASHKSPSCPFAAYQQLYSAHTSQVLKVHSEKSQLASLGCRRHIHIDSVGCCTDTLVPPITLAPSLSIRCCTALAKGLEIPQSAAQARLTLRPINTKPLGRHRACPAAFHQNWATHRTTCPAWPCGPCVAAAVKRTAAVTQTTEEPAAVTLRKHLWSLEPAIKAKPSRGYATSQLAHTKISLLLVHQAWS